jgi:hypothetical protein
VVQGMSLLGGETSGGGGGGGRGQESNQVAIEIEQCAHFAVAAEGGGGLGGGGGGGGGAGARGGNAGGGDNGTAGGRGNANDAKRKRKSKRRGKKKAPTTFSIQLAATTSSGCVLSANASGQKVGGERELVLCAMRELETLIASGSCVDEHTQDQLIVFMALARGSTSTLCCLTPKMSQHADTAMHFASLLTGATFEVKDGGDGRRTITCQAK